jgi:tetratricopeptide (TPR) repeat protein
VEQGKIYLKQGQFRAAIDDFTRALLIDSNDASVLNFRGNAHYNLTQFKEAIADLDKAILLKPDFADA